MDNTNTGTFINLMIYGIFIGCTFVYRGILEQMNCEVRALVNENKELQKKLEDTENQLRKFGDIGNPPDNANTPPISQHMFKIEASDEIWLCEYCEREFVELCDCEDHENLCKMNTRESDNINDINCCNINNDKNRNNQPRRKSSKVTMRPIFECEEESSP